MRWVESEPVARTAVATAMLMAASYEIIWAEALTDPRSGYFDPEAQPARNTPYTAIDDMASRNRIPIGGSASCSHVWWPAMEILSPMGMMAKATKAGTVVR